MTKTISKEAELAWLEDEAVRYKALLSRDESRAYWLQKTLERDERDIPDRTDREVSVKTLSIPHIGPQKLLWLVLLKQHYGNSRHNNI